MDAILRQEYEDNGIQVFELAYPDPYFKTKTFIQLPDGRRLAHYDVLYQIPKLNDNEEFSVAYTALLPEAAVDGVRTALWDYEYTEGLIPPIWVIGLAKLILTIIGGIILFVGIYLIIEKIYAPCGITGSEIPINDCWKKIIMPNCEWRTINSCAGPDNNGDGYPDGEWGEDDWQGGIDIGGILIIGVGAIAAIAGIYVITKLMTRPKYYYPRRAPGIEYIE